jgi:hypothetical protein
MIVMMFNRGKNSAKDNISPSRLKHTDVLLQETTYETTP